MNELIEQIMAIINKNMHIEYTNNFTPRRVLTTNDLYKIKNALIKLLNKEN